jgi:hypothetical protein
MMLPIWRALLPLAVFAAIGAVLDRALSLDLGGGWGKWVRWATCGIVACFAAALHPLVLGALVALAVAGRVAKSRRPLLPQTAPSTTRSGPAWWGVTAFALGLVVICRPATLVYWDSFVWLAKAKIESAGGWGALRAATLDQSADVVPAGYPLFWPLAASWLSMGGTSMEAVAAGAAAMTLLTLMLFLDAAADATGGAGTASDRPRWASAALGLLGITPLVFVHLRSAYVDLPVGLLAATCTLRLACSLERRDESKGDLSVAALCAAALVGMKDEGMAHVAALVVAIVIVQIWARQRLPLAPGLTVLAAAAIPFNGWRMLLLAHGVTDVDHRPSTPNFEATGAVVRTVWVHLTDTRSWGALWPIAFACVGLVLARGKTFGIVTRLATLTFLAQGGLLVAALLFGSDRVRVFAFEGTLVNRLLLQLAPGAGAMLMLAVADAARASRMVPRTASRALPIAATPGGQVPAMTRSSE